MENEARKSLVSKKQKLQQDLFKRISDFEQETGLSVTEIELIRQQVAGSADPKLNAVHMKVELISRE